LESCEGKGLKKGEVDQRILLGSLGEITGAGGSEQRRRRWRRRGDN
jgi:hypothetical protein